jgi:hypothetical protein
MTMKKHVISLCAALWLIGCGSTSYEREDKVIVVPSTAAMQPPYSGDGGQPQRRYVVRMSDGERDWEVEFPETASGYSLRIPIKGRSDGGLVVGGKGRTLADKELEASMRRQNPDMEREGIYQDGKNTADPPRKPPGSELGNGAQDAAKGADSAKKSDEWAGTEADPAPSRQSYLLGIEQVKQLYRAGKYELAITFLKNLDQDYPNDPQIMSMMGTLYLKINREELAREYWERVLRVDPNNRAVIEALKQLNQRRGGQAAPARREEAPATPPAERAPRTQPERIEPPPPTPVPPVP